MNAFVVIAIAFIAMEPIAAVAHRFVMHGRGYSWHRSHHLAAATRFEKNDLYPLVFASMTMAAMALGTVVHGLQSLVWIGVGVTLYGCAYGLVHEVCIHGRGVGRPVGHGRYIAYVRAAHRTHHMGGRGPYGFLAPITTSRARQRVATIERRSSAARDASGRPTPARTTVDSLRTSGTDARRLNTS